jgi:hypothetical protein
MVTLIIVGIIAALGRVQDRELAFDSLCTQNSGVSAMVEKILQDVRTLSAEQREELWKRVAAEEASNLDEWEKQIERDSNAGKLDHLLNELKEDIAAGRVKPLDEVINEP